MKQVTPAYRELQNRITDLRNEISFNYSGLAHGGPAREDWVRDIRSQIRELLGQAEQMDREGRRWVES